MDKGSLIYIAGNGLVGSAIFRQLQSEGYINIITRTHSELDLTDSEQVDWFFEKYKPEYVFLCAAKVGGINANNKYPVQFLTENLKIELNVIENCYNHNIKKLLFFGSSCIFPRDCQQPIKEEYLMSGPLEQSNSAYALAKIAGIELCKACNKQYGTNYISVMPTNLYGPNDSFDLENAHVLPTLIRKFHEAKINNTKFVEVWGTGKHRREFLNVSDLAEACVFLMNNYNDSEIINIGTGEDLTIQELSYLIKEIIGYDGKIKFDTTKLDGTPRKLLDVSKIHNLGWHHKVGLVEGIKQTYKWYTESLNE